MSPTTFIASTSPDVRPDGRSICVMSPVTTAFEPKPRRVRNIFICSVVVFCASSRMTNASLSVRPRMKAIGATSIVPRSSSRSTRSSVDHVVERVVERTQVRIDLLLQIARQEAELLARLDRRARQDDAADALRQQIRHRLRHRQIGLAGAGRADAEHDVVLVDRVEIRRWLTLFGSTCRLPDGARRAAQEVVGELDLVVLRDELRGRPHVAFGQLVAAAQQPRKLLQYTLSARDVGRLALDDDLVAARPGADVEQRLEMLEVLVVAPEHRLNPVVGDSDFAGGGVDGMAITSYFVTITLHERFDLSTAGLPVTFAVPAASSIRL